MILKKKTMVFWGGVFFLLGGSLDAVIQSSFLEERTKTLFQKSFGSKKWHHSYFFKNKGTFIKEKTLYIQGFFQEALEGFLAILQDSRQASLLIEEAYYYAGLCYRALSDNVNASVCWDHLIEQKSRSCYKPFALIAKSRLLYKEGNFSFALRLLERLFQMVSFRNLPPDILKNFVHLLEFFSNTERANDLKTMISKHVNISFDKGFFEEKKFHSNQIFYALQIGSFKNWRNAWKLERDLKRKKLDAYVVKEQSQHDYFYKVRIGSETSIYKINQYRYRLIKVQNIMSTVVSQNFSFHQLHH